MNEGALVTATADDSIHLWNFKQKKPEVVHTLKFQRERITSMHLPLQSKWMYVGTDRGNIHVVNIDNFRVSGYVINWNKAIEVIRKTHPGPVVHLSDCPTDASKLLIGYETGQLVLWDLRTRAADARWQTAEPIRSVAWHHEGKQFMCSHTDGSLTTWMARPSPKPINHTHPHSKPGKDGKPEACKPIGKVEWLSARSGETYVIFSGGLAYDTAGRTPSITVMHGKSTTVLEMEHNVVDFITLCDSPYNYELQEPYAIVVVLHNDLVVIDLLTQGFPCFENPYPMDIHESPVTCCTYFADCPSDLIPAFYSVGCRSQKRTGFSEREWPLSGGEWSPTSCSYNEIIVTGHSDGSIKFWDASAGTLQVLYKLKTNKVFERPRARSVEGSAAGEDDPYAVHLITLCPESRKLCVAGSTHVILFNFRKNEAVSETYCLEIPIVYEAGQDDADASPDPECAVYDGSEPESKKSSLEYTTAVRVRGGQQKKSAGFQAHLVCITPHINGEPPGQLTALTINTVYGLMAYGNSCGLVIVDIIQRVCVLSMGTPDLYGNADPYQRAPRSPKRPTASGTLTDTFRETIDDRSGSSPTTDQMNGVCLSPGSVAAATCTAVRQGGSGAGGRSRSQGTRKLHKCMSTASYSEGVVEGPIHGGLLPARHSTLLVTRQYCSFDKLDSSFSRSRSSSMSSLENITSEAIQSLAFADSFTRKSVDASPCPALWVGTSLGSVLTVLIQLSGSDSTRATQPIAVQPCGTIFRLKGCIRTIAFLDCAGSLMVYQGESWRDDERNKTPTKCPNSRMSPTLSGGGSQDSGGGGGSGGDRQYVVFASEKQARVVALPSHNCIYKQQLADTDFIIRAEIITLKDGVCLACYISSGYISVYSLPSLRPLIHTEFLPLSDLSFQTTNKGIVDPMLSIWGQQMFVIEDTDQIGKTFCFSNRGHGLYLCSSTELQKFTLSSEFNASYSEMAGELFMPHDMPEPPKQSFFSGLFGGGARSLDREELFGEASGRASRTVAKHIPGPSAKLEELEAASKTATSEISRARLMMLERGERLSQLEDTTQKMMNDAEDFASTAHSLKLKYKDKKWYQL